MIRRMRNLNFSRRDLLRHSVAAAALTGIGGLSRIGRAGPPGPWSERPKSAAKTVNFYGWQYGEIYANLAKRFEADWGVKLEQNLSPYNDFAQKFATAYAGGAKIDTGIGFNTIMGVWVEQGVVEPLDDLPGIKDYLADFTPLQRSLSTFNGRTYALPYYTTVWVWNYYQDLVEKAGFSQPFRSYEELIEQCLKAKKDGVSQHPISWVAGVGPEQLPGTWYSLTWNKTGGKFFDAQGNHQLGPGSPARETLKWWADTFTKLDISDPESLKLQMTSGAKAFMAGKNLYRGPNHHYGLNLMNDPSQSPIAGKIKVLSFPGDGRTIANGNVYFMSSANQNKEWAWKLLQYLGGRTKDGEYSQGRLMATQAMFGSGYQSLMDSKEVLDSWSKWGDIRVLQDSWKKSTYIGDVVQSFYKQWHQPWTDIINIELQKCLSGQVTADQACDTIVAGIDKAKRAI